MTTTYYIEYTCFEPDVGWHSEVATVKARTKIGAFKKFMETCPTILEDIDSIKSEDELEEEGTLIHVSNDERKVLDISTRNHIEELVAYVDNPYCTESIKTTVNASVATLNGFRTKLALKELHPTERACTAV